jgi:hypothetical protein
VSDHITFAAEILLASKATNRISDFFTYTTFTCTVGTGANVVLKDSISLGITSIFFVFHASFPLAFLIGSFFFLLNCEMLASMMSFPVRLNE